MGSTPSFPLEHWFIKLTRADWRRGVSFAEPDDLDRPYDLRRGDRITMRWPAPEDGSRNNSAMSLCAALADAGLGHQERLARMHVWNMTGDPLTDAEVEGVAASIARGNFQNQVAGANRMSDSMERIIAAEVAGGHMTPEAIEAAHDPVPAPEPVAAEFQWHPSSYLRGLQDPEWLIRDILPVGALVQIYGQQGSFKSFIALDMCFTLSSERKFWMHGDGSDEGFECVTCDTAYIAGEGVPGLKLREAAWRQEYGGDAAGHTVWVLGKMPQFSEENQAHNALAALAAETKRVGRPFPPLLVVDTLARGTGAWDENSSGEMSQLIALCDSLIVEHGCTIILVHHVGHGDKTRARGSSVIAGAVSTILQVEATGLAAVVTMTKQKDAKKAKPFALNAKIVHLGENARGEPRSSLTFSRGHIAQEAAKMEDPSEKRLTAWAHVLMKGTTPNAQHIAAAIAAETKEDPGEVHSWVRSKLKEAEKKD